MLDGRRAHTLKHILSCVVGCRSGRNIKHNECNSINKMLVANFFSYLFSAPLLTGYTDISAKVLTMRYTLDMLYTRVVQW